MSAIIEIESTHATPSGVRYRVWHDGSVLIESCREPLTDGARALVKKGVTGRVQMKRVGAPGFDMQGLIAVLATQTISEGQTGVPRFAKWSEYDAYPHLPSGAAACSADSPAGSTSSPIPSGTNQPERATQSTEQPTSAAEVTTPDANTHGQTGAADISGLAASVPASRKAVAKTVGQSGQIAAVELPVDANHDSDGPKSRPGDAAASLTQQSNSPRQERPSAQERSSDRSGGQFGDAPKPAHIQRADEGIQA